MEHASVDCSNCSLSPHLQPLKLEDVIRLCADAGGSSPHIAPAVSLPPEDAHRLTGEEEERSVYTGDFPPSC